MVVRKRKKSRKLRGRTRTMGWGRIGQHRKSGSRGGFGAAGMHKHKWSWIIKYAPKWFGKHGFTQPPETQYGVYVINVGELDEIARKMLIENKVVKENDKIVINTVEMGYNRVLGRGKVTLPLKVIVMDISEKAKKKIENAGGQVVFIKK